MNLILFFALVYASGATHNANVKSVPRVIQPKRVAIRGAEKFARHPAATVLTPRTPGKVSVPPKVSPKILEPVCSISVKDCDLDTILQQIYLQTQTNMVLLAKPSTKITLNLHQVSLVDLVRHLCALTDLSVLKVDNTYVFAADSQLKASYPKEYAVIHPPVVTTPGPKDVIVFRTYKPQASDVQRLGDALFQMFKDRHLSVITATGNAVPISLPTDPQLATPNFGTGSSQGSGSQGSVGQPLGSDLQKNFADGIRIPGTGRSLILAGTEEVIDEALAVAKQLDIPPLQINVLCKVYEVSNDALKDLGINYSFGTMSIVEQPVTTGGIGFQRGPLSILATLSDLQTSQKATILSSPNITALDGIPSTLLIGQQINFPDLLGYTLNNAPIFGTKVIDAGISLQVSALVSDADMITMEIRPSISTVTGFLQLNGASYPQLSTRKAQATLRIRSGETFIMAGLMNQQDIDAMEKVPVLGDIPILGELFRHRKKTHNSSQLIITITPTVIHSK